MKSRHFFNFLSKGDKSLFDIPVSTQFDFLNKLSNPNSNIDRSYNQYLSQQLFVSQYKRLILNIGSFIIAPFVLFYLLLRRLCCSNHLYDAEAVGEFKGLEEIIPEELSSRYNINNDFWRDGFSLSLKDLLFIIKLPYIKSPYFSLKVILKIAQYSYCIKKHSPKSIIVHNEYSFTSSALTDYCKRHNVLHINVMHGEKLFFIRDSWFKYDKCYVWDKHYVNLFSEMKADPKQFVIAIPPSMKIDAKLYSNTDFYADYKYFLGNNSELEIEHIVKVMEVLKKKGKSIKFRLHPRYSNLNIIKKYINDENIEYPQRVTIIESISNLEYAIGSYSTVLLQAYFSGKKIILDDVIYKNQFDKLKDLNYILTKIENTKLSDICPQKVF